MHIIKEQRISHRGIGYQYPHNFKDHYVKQQYLPDELVGQTFYKPSENGYEKEIIEYLKKINKEKES